jgi:hypothetical protein
VVLNRDEVEADPVGKRREAHDRLGCLGRGRDEDPELELVSVVGHAGASFSIC